MRSSGYVLWLSVLLVGLSCQADEIEFEHANPNSAESIEATSASETGNEILNNGGGDYDGDPIIYKDSPTRVDPKNKYVQYMRAPTVSWDANKLETATPTITVGSSNTAPTMRTAETVDREVRSVYTGQIMQVAAPQRATLGPIAQRGRAASTTLGAARTEQEFLSSNRGMVDILLVMDNSGSMYQESQYIQNYLPELLKHIWRSDWRLGMVNSSGSKCNVTTLTVQQASDANTISYPLDRSSMIYNNFHHDLAKQTSNKPTPYYLAPYFFHSTSYTGDRVVNYSDYRWLSPCSYNITSSCSASSLNYYRNDQSYNPLKKYFGQEGLNIFTTDATVPDSGDEKLLSKARWVLEGKEGSTCEGWARDEATVIAIIVTDEGHNCKDTDYTYCSISNYEEFASSYGSNRNFKTYGVLSSTQQPDRSYLPQWDSTQLGALDGYVINYNEYFEGGRVQGYFRNLPNGYNRYSPPARVLSSNSYHEILSSNYGHRPLHLISMAIADELRNIYSPLSHVPDDSSAAVSVASYSTDRSTRLSEYRYSTLDACGTAGLSSTDPCYVVHAEAKSFELVAHGNMAHFDKKVKIAYNYGGTQVSAVPFDDSWTLSFVPDHATVNFSVTLANGTTRVLTRGTDYTISGTTVAVSASNVQQLVHEGSSVTITYSSPVSRASNFPLDSQYQLPSGASIVSGSAQVTLVAADGAETSLTNGFSFNGLAVNFNNRVPEAGGGFILQYRYNGDAIAEYSYTRNSNTDSSTPLQCSNLSRGNAAVACSYNATTQSLSFTNSTQFGAGDVIEIVETLQRVGTGVTIGDHSLPDNYAEDEVVSASAAGDTCSSKRSAPELLVVNSGAIAFSSMTGTDCRIINSINSNPNLQVSLSYSVYKNLPDDFLQLDKKFFAQHRGKYKFEWWDVTVNAATTTDFVVEDYRITEINGAMTDSEEDLRTTLGNNARIQVVVRLYHAL